MWDKNYANLTLYDISNILTVWKWDEYSTLDNAKESVSKQEDHRKVYFKTG